MLEPLETNGSAPQASGEAPTSFGAGAICSDSIPGPWPSTFETTRRKTRDSWKDGWDRSDNCPPDPKSDPRPGRKSRRSQLAAKQGSELAHEARRQVVRTLRSAGYFARKNYSRHIVGIRPVGFNPATGQPYLIDDWRYSEGPMKGLAAVDPFKVARDLSFCGGSWDVTLRLQDQVVVPTPLPKFCRRFHVCPVCAHSRSVRLAGAIRQIIRAEGEIDRVVFVTLTQRADSEESLDQAINRFRDGLRRIWSKRPRKKWVKNFQSHFYGIEVTRGADGDASHPGRHWHVHCHLVLRLADEATMTEARDYLVARWEQASGAAARDAGREGYGWDPVAGLQRKGESYTSARDRLLQGDASGPWWKPFSASDNKLAAIYQACKYPSPITKLHWIPLVEFLAAAHGRRWHESGGGWRGPLRRAEELAEDEESDTDSVDFGLNISMRGPGGCPDLEEVAPDLGIEDGPGVPEGVPEHVATRGGLGCSPLVSVSYFGGRRLLAETHGNPPDPAPVPRLPTSTAISKHRQERTTPAKVNQDQRRGYQRGYQTRRSPRVRAPDEELRFRLSRAGQEEWVLELLEGQGFEVLEDITGVWACCPAGQVEGLLRSGGARSLKVATSKLATR